MRMSSRYCRSRDVKQNRRFENLRAAEVIAHLLHTATLTQIYVASEHDLQLATHLRPSTERPVRLFREPHHHIDVAVRAELLRARHAPEESKLRHLPLAAEVAELLLRDVDRDHAAAPWHFLYFLPEPHGQGSLRPTFASRCLTVCDCDGPEPEKNIGCWRGGAGKARRGAASWRCSPSRSTTTSIFQRNLTTRSWIRSIISWNISNDSFLYSISGSRWP